ncbi:PASTA domain-containing protein [Micromonospora sp. NPDC000089]|uniref:PASTA domain-containing protein n=1 Tax=unclassified Micromonospora TaxID=2617518 RepID=UPI003695C51D
MSDDRQEPPADDATRPLPRGDQPGADPTRPLPHPAGQPADQQPLDATARHEPLDATARHEPVDATRPLPPDAAGTPPPAPPVWSGRAGVPVPRPADYREPAEWYPDDQRGRRWWLPILLGILALLLVAVIGTGVWLVLRSARDDAPTPTPPPVPTSAPVTSAAPTTTAPTTEPPSSPPTTTAAARIPMPALTGLSRTTAQSLLDRLGLAYRVQTRPSDQPAGTVIETDPAAGEPVARGDEVTLVVAEATESRSPSASTSASSGRPSPEATATR